MTERIHFLTFTVEGDSMFPLDMLRYDHCWPATQEDVVKLMIARVDAREKRQVRLTGFSYEARSGGVNEARWASFGWKVVGIERR